MSCIVSVLAEEIVMTPSKKGKTTSIRVEKVLRDQIDDSKVKHKGQGQNRGLVINQKVEGNECQMISTMYS